MAWASTITVRSSAKLLAAVIEVDKPALPMGRPLLHCLCRKHSALSLGMQSLITRSADKTATTVAVIIVVAYQHSPWSPKYSSNRSRPAPPFRFLPLVLAALLVEVIPDDITDRRAPQCV